MNRALIFFAFAALMTSTACASDSARSATPIPFTHGVNLVSHADMVAILAVVQRDLARKPGHQPIESVAIVSPRKAIVSYRREVSYYGEFCIVERYAGGWRITEQKSSIS
jgi:hypothetical protein